jgi:membrane-bound serine protease (ClpP class)
VNRLKLFLVLIPLFLLFAFIKGINANDEFYVISLDQTIDAGAQNFIYRTIDEAISKNAKYYVIIMNTFGGYSIHMDNIIKKLQEGEARGLTIITLVAPVGAHATSAGAFIAMASTKIYMVKGTSIGSATPVGGALDEETKRKIISAFAKYMESLAEARNRNKTAAAEMVTLGKSYTAEEAYRLGLIDKVLNSTSISGALNEIGAKNVNIVYPDYVSRFLSFLSDPTVLTFIGLIATFALIAGLYAQSEILIAAGIVGWILTFIGYSVVPVFIGAILLIIIGAILLAIELKIGEGLGAIPAGIFIALGFLLFYIPITPPDIKPGELPNIHFFQIGISQYSIAAVIAVLTMIGGLYLHKITQTIKKRGKVYDISLILNKIGYAVTEISPDNPGVVNVEAEEWTAESDSYIPKGSKVKVVEVKGNVLKVKKLEE